MKNYFRCGNSRIGILSENTFFIENYIPKSTIFLENYISLQ